MTNQEKISQFRNDKDKRLELKKLLGSKVLQEALSLVLGHYKPGPIRYQTSDASLALSLTQAYLAGAHEFPETLEKLTDVPSSSPVQPVEWGRLNETPKKRS